MNLTISNLDCQRTARRSGCYRPSKRQCDRSSKAFTLGYR